jgi:hypothetical protein
MVFNQKPKSSNFFDAVLHQNFVCRQEIIRLSDLRSFKQGDVITKVVN